jgi:hypothetical protein
MQRPWGTRRWGAIGPVVAVINREGEDEAGRLGAAGLEEFMERKTVAS